MNLKAILHLLTLFCLFCMTSSINAEETAKPEEIIKSDKVSFGLDKRVKILGALCLIFAPIGLFAYKKNRINSPAKGSQLKVLEKKSLDQNSSLILVESLGSVLLISKSGTQISLIKDYKSEMNLNTNSSHEVDPYSNLSLIANI